MQRVSTLCIQVLLVVLWLCFFVYQSDKTGMLQAVATLLCQASRQVFDAYVLQ